MKLNFKMNKKGDIASLIYAIVAIFIIGILFFFMNHMNNQLFTSFDKYLNSTENYNDSVARDTLNEIQDVDNSVWDYLFLFFAIGMFLVMGLTAYSTRISPVFYWIYGVLSLVALGVAVILSDIWQEMVQKSEFSGTLARFPITNAILGTYYPTFIAAFIMLMMILLFGKLPGSGGQNEI